MKKLMIVFSLMMSLFVMSDSKVFAFGDGFLSKGEGYTMTVITDKYSPNPISIEEFKNNLFDNNLETKVNFNNYGNAVQTFVIEFDEPIDIKNIKFAQTSPFTFPYVQFEDINKKGIAGFRLNPTMGNENYNISQVKKIKFETSPNSNLAEFEIYTDNVFYESINSLAYQYDYKSVYFSWMNPESIDFENVEVYKNGVFEKYVYKPKNSTTIDNLEPETEYTFNLIASYIDGGKSADRTVTLTTLPKPEEVEVKQLKAKATYERVDLSWQLPDNDDLQHVNIYRDVINKQTALETFFVGKKAYASEPTKIFETNGTYFNDLTVEPETTYYYLLTTTVDGEESEGVGIEVTTAEAPGPEMVGVETETNENGDYIITWTEPIKGQVKILVGGKEYAVVSASNKTFTVPVDDMKYNVFGGADVTIQAIDENGKGGSITNPDSGIGGTGNLSIPFDAKDLIVSGNSLMMLVAPFLLLALSFLLVPKLRQLIFNSIQNNKSSSSRVARAERQYGTRRTS